MLQENMDLIFFLKERADPFHFLPIEGIEELRRAELLKNVCQGELTQKRIFMIPGGLPFGGERKNRHPRVKLS